MSKIYPLERLKVIDLQPCQLLGKLSSPAVKFYQKESSYFDYLDKPVVTSDLQVLWHWKDVLVAKKNGILEMDCFVAKDIEEEDIIRFVSSGVSFKELSYYDRYVFIRHIGDYLHGTEKGKAWAKEISGRKLTQKIGTIVGYDHETIKRYKYIGDYNYEILKEENMNLNEMYLFVRRLKEEQGKEKELAGNPMPVKAPEFPLQQPDLETAIRYIDVYVPEWRKSFSLPLIESTQETEFYTKYTSDGNAYIKCEVKNPELFIKEFRSISDGVKGKINLWTSETI